MANTNLLRFVQPYKFTYQVLCHHVHHSYRCGLTGEVSVMTWGRVRDEGLPLP